MKYYLRPSTDFGGFFILDNMEKQAICGIYKITSPSGRIYIGKSKDILDRWYKYKKLRCKSQPLIYRSLLKYGAESHIFEVIEECCIDNLSSRERYWQDFYDVMSKGLNLRLSSSEDISGYLSEDTKQKMSKNHARYWTGKTGENNPHYGKPKSEEHKKKVSDTRIEKGLAKGENNPMFGRNHSEETRKEWSIKRKNKNLNCDNPNAKKVIDKVTKEIWCSIKEAAEKNNLKCDTLKAYFSGKLKNKTNLELLDRYKEE